MMYAPENQNSNERESAAQISTTAKAIKEAKQELYVAVSAINRAMDEAHKERIGVRETDADKWLAAQLKYERINRSRDFVEDAIGMLNRLEK